MSEKKKGRQRKMEEETPSKEEYAVAKYLRFGLPVREGKMHGMEVKCFFGNAAVDKLMESKWSATNNKKDPLFTTRASCVTYLVGLLQKGLFHRAEREKRKKDKDKDKAEKTKRKKNKEKEVEKEESPKADEELRERKSKKDKKGKKEKEAETNGDEIEKKESEKKSEKKEKKEKRLKLVMPEEQFFEDSEEVYVWIYDPVNAKTFFIGLLMVLGAIGLCMFPLWPEEVRVGVYYLSLSAAGFVGFILFLVVVRLILFCFVWTLTLGVHHFWFLPNLTEDVGFFDSFKPLYHHEKVTGDSKSKDDDKDKKKKKKKKDGDREEEKDSEQKKEKSSDKDDSDEFEVIKKDDIVDEEENEDTENNGLDDDDDNQEEDLNESEEEEEEEEEANAEQEEKKTK